MDQYYLEDQSSLAKEDGLCGRVLRRISKDTTEVDRLGVTRDTTHTSLLPSYTVIPFCVSLPCP